MDASIALALMNLPTEIQLRIIHHKVKQPHTISMTAAYFVQAMNAILSPFAPYPNLVEIARGEFWRANTFRIVASHSLVVSRDGAPALQLIFNNFALPPSPKIRHVEIIVDLTLRGANWNTLNPVRPLPTTTALFAVLPALLPRLENITIRALNSGVVAPGAFYSLNGQLHAAHLSPWYRAAERAMRMYGLVYAVQHLHFPRWRKGPGVEKRVLLVQSSTGAGPVKRVTSGVPSLHYPPERGLKATTRHLMWKMCDWAVVEVKFV